MPVLVRIQRPRRLLTAQKREAWICVDTCAHAANLRHEDVTHLSNGADWPSTAVSPLPIVPIGLRLASCSEKRKRCTLRRTIQPVFSYFASAVPPIHQHILPLQHSSSQSNASSNLYGTRNQSFTIAIHCCSCGVTGECV